MPFPTKAVTTIPKMDELLFCQGMGSSRTVVFEEEAMLLTIWKVPGALKKKLYRSHRGERRVELKFKVPGIPSSYLRLVASAWLQRSEEARIWISPTSEPNTQ